MTTYQLPIETGMLCQISPSRISGRSQRRKHTPKRGL